MRLRGNQAVFWRQLGESQIGSDSYSATVLSDLSIGQQKLLEMLPRVREPKDLTRAIAQCELSASQATEFLDSLRKRNILLDDDRPLVTADDHYWDGLGLSPARRSAELSQAIVGLGGGNEMVEKIARQLAQAGLRTLLILPHSQETQQMRARRVDFARHLSKEIPGLRTRAPLHSRPDLVVTLEDGRVDQERARALFQASIPLLPVVIQDSHTQLGPLVIPGAGPCLRCLELWRTEADPCWPLVLAQIPSTLTARTETLLEQQIVVTVCRMVLTILLGHRARWLGHSLALNACDVIPCEYEWQVHPTCGCAGLPDAPTAG